jgi:hypothetical protein
VTITVTVATFGAGITGTMLNGGTLRQALENGVKGAATGAIMGAISGGFGSSWNMERVMVNGMGGGVSSEIMGGKFEDGFKVAFVTAAAAYA